MFQRQFLQYGYWSTEEEWLGGDPQVEAVKVDVCVSLLETVTCVAFTPGRWELASAHQRISSRETRYRGRCMLSIRSW